MLTLATLILVKDEKACSGICHITVLLDAAIFLLCIAMR